ncbi:hypothetical protein KXS07_36705 [Inquilinus limosus]|uniref:hypothetical protein n=1 Tax=Inquilinus limosus TaxID=171674 RepID=UPI003F14DF49
MEDLEAASTKAADAMTVMIVDPDGTRRADDLGASVGGHDAHERTRGRNTGLGLDHRFLSID